MTMVDRQWPWLTINYLQLPFWPWSTMFC